jgi:hypothetical protein
MKHFSKDEIIDAVDGALSTARSGHLASCASCREQVEALRGTLARTKEVDIPEPSPLFWEHFSSNVRDAIREPASETTGPGGLLRPAALWTVAATVAVGIVAVAVMSRISNSSRFVAPSAMDTAPATQAGAPRMAPNVVDDIDADEGWAFVRSVADEVSWDETHAEGLDARPNSVELIAAEMTPLERRELARLVEDELRRKGA